MSNKLLSAKYDVVFKKLFADENNKDLLKHFLAQILSIPIEKIKDVTVTNPGLTPDILSEKFSQMDIKLYLNDDTIVNIEMQISHEKNFNERVLYYWAKMYSQVLKEGEKYSKLKKCISINVLNFPYKQDKKDYHFIYKIRDEKDYDLFSDYLEIHFLTLNKISDTPNSKDLSELWLQLINAETEEEFVMLNNTRVPEIEKAVNIIKKMNDDDEIRELVWIREKARHEEATRLGDAMEEGIEKGIEIGREKGRKEGMKEGRAEERASIIKQLKEFGMSEEQIKLALKL